MPIPHIIIISGSVREGRKSDRVAQFFKKILLGNSVTTEILDLSDFNFPIFNERIKYMQNVPEAVQSFADKIKNADGVILVSPEYNGGYPASVKNIIDLLYDEWQNKPVAITTVSAGAFAGSQVIMQLQWVLWKIKAWVVPTMFPVANVEQSFSENGDASDQEKTEKRAEKFVADLLWCVEARKRMQN